MKLQKRPGVRPNGGSELKGGCESRIEVIVKLQKSPGGGGSARVGDQGGRVDMN